MKTLSQEKKKSWQNKLISLFIPILLIILWQKAAININNNAVLPTVGQVLENFLHPMQEFIGIGSLPRNIMYSLVRVFIGYVIAIILGLPLGLIMGYKERIRALLENMINIFKPVPSIAWQPLVLGWFGIFSLARMLRLEYGAAFSVLDNFKMTMIFIIFLGAFFSIWGGSLHGVLNARKVLIESAEVLGASQKDIFFHVLIPAAGPSIISGLRNGLTSAWAALVAAEMMPGSMTGIGYLITHARELSRMDLVVTGIICIGLIGAAFDGVFRLILKTKFSWEQYEK